MTPSEQCDFYFPLDLFGTKFLCSSLRRAIGHTFHVCLTTPVACCTLSCHSCCITTPSQSFTSIKYGTICERSWTFCSYFPAHAHHIARNPPFPRPAASDTDLALVLEALRLSQLPPTLTLRACSWQGVRDPLALSKFFLSVQLPHSVILLPAPPPARYVLAAVAATIGTGIACSLDYRILSASDSTSACSPTQTLLDPIRRVELEKGSPNATFASACVTPSPQRCRRRCARSTTTENTRPLSRS